MKNVKILLILALIFTGCATARTKSSDPVMRVGIDADAMPLESYVRLQHALVQSGKFVVVDRAAGFQFLDKEQKMQHESNRFGSADRYAEWGKMYGIGGVIVGIQFCQMRYGWGGEHFKCQENLSLIDVTTGETLAVAEDSENTDYLIQNPKWDDAVDQLVDNLPKTFINDDDLHQTIKYSSTLEKYRKQVKTENN